MFNLVAYGSLLNRAELSKHRFDHARATPVMVRGFRRSFSQEPSWRVGVGRQRAVLSVSECSDASFNAILLTGLADDLLDTLDQRERGYFRTALEGGALSPLLDRETDPVRGDVFMYCGKPEKQDADLLPNFEYLELCVRGARQWGQEFLEQFLSSTFVVDQTVGQYLACQSELNG